MADVLLPRRHATHPGREGAANTMFRGVKRQDWLGRAGTARKLGRQLVLRREIAYWVVVPERDPAERKRVEQRGGPREPMRLRSAKLLDASYRFVCECRICDRSLNGLKLALARNIGLPPRLAVHIDETGEIRGARIIWRRGPLVGLRLQEAPPLGALRASDRYALQERYYALLG
jgi:hypothetical protein